MGVEVGPFREGPTAEGGCYLSENKLTLRELGGGRLRDGQGHHETLNPSRDQPLSSVPQEALAEMKPLSCAWAGQEGGCWKQGQAV